MSRPPEHRSLDEVKKLLRSLEETSAADQQPAVATLSAKTLEQARRPPPLPVVTAVGAQTQDEMAAEPQRTAAPGFQHAWQPPAVERTDSRPAAPSNQRTWIAGIGSVIGMIIGGGVAFLQLNGSDGAVEKPVVETKVAVSATVNGELPAPQDVRPGKREPEIQLRTEPAKEQAARGAAEKLAQASDRASTRGGDQPRERRSFDSVAADTEQRPPPPSRPSPATAAQAPTAIQPSLAIAATLTVTAGQSSPLPIKVEGASAAAVVSITGLPQGTQVNVGKALPGNLWHVAASELSGLSITVPSSGQGRSDLTLELRTATADVIAQAKATLITAATPSPPPPAMSDAVRTDDADVGHLLAEGQRLWKAGHVAQARLALRRAADAGSAEAARNLGDSYDPAKLFAIGARGISGDIDKAIYWYERADELGDPLAKARLLSLGGR